MDKENKVNIPFPMILALEVTLVYLKNIYFLSFYYYFKNK